RNHDGRRQPVAALLQSRRIQPRNAADRRKPEAAVRCLNYGRFRDLLPESPGSPSNSSKCSPETAESGWLNHFLNAAAGTCVIPENPLIHKSPDAVSTMPEALPGRSRFFHRMLKKLPCLNRRMPPGPASQTRSSRTNIVVWETSRTLRTKV